MSSPLPQHCPSTRELDDLELLLNGALAPRTRFDDASDPQAVVTLDLPEGLATRAVELVDPEGMPLARRDADGTLTALAHPAFGPFRRLHLSPERARAAHPGRAWIPVDDALTTAELSRLQRHGPLVLLALVGHGTGRLSPVGLLRATLAAAEVLPDAVVVAAPLAAHPQASPVAEERLRERVVSNYAGPNPVWAVPPRSQAPVAADHPASVAAVITHDQPSPDRQGLVLFFTGLSGSGKSTLARALTDRILEQGVRTVTSLDGDVVRRQLSAGLTFSKADRETNIRRIGWVAAEVARHGGVAVCSPIAPFDETRRQVRAHVEEAGGRFFLVHVATPLEECERRDRKGLYAKARRGEIPEFTGISSPYEVPEDADVRVDTTGRSVEAAVDDVVAALRAEGLVDLPSGGTNVVPLFAAPAAQRPQSPVAPAAPVAAAAVAATPPAPAPRRATSERADLASHLAVVFVCTANICRSPYMELRATEMVGNALEVVSVGTDAQRGRRMDGEMSALLPAGASEHFRSHPVSRDLVDAADLLLAAEQSHVDALLERYPDAFRKIFTLGQFAETARASQATGRDLITQAGQFRAPRRDEHDIADPFKLGPEPARKAAEQIDGYLQDVLGPLSHR